MRVHEDMRFQTIIERMETLHLNRRTDEMRVLLEELQTLAETEQDDIGLTAAYFYRDVLSDKQPGDKEYMQYVKRALKIAEAKNIPYYQMKVSNSMGIMYSELSDFHTSLEHYLCALHVAEDHPEFCYAGIVLNNVGNLFVWLEEYVEATTYLERAYDKSIVENANDKQLIALIILNLVELYSNLENYEKVHEWENKNRDILIEEEKVVISCICQINAAKQQLKAGQKEAAKAIIRDFMAMSDTISDYIYIFRCCINGLRFGIEMADFDLCVALVEKMERMQKNSAMTSFAFDYALVKIEYYEAFRERILSQGHAFYEEYYRQSQARIMQLRNTYARSLSVKIALEEAKDETKSVQLKNEQLQKDMERDIFTNLYNKVSTEKHVRRAMQERTADTIQGLLLIDIDLFKRINDYFGHSSGDKVLTSVAEIIESVCGGPKIAGRFGGDEFLLFLDKQESVATIKAVAETLLERVRSVIQLPDDRVSEITLSIGICVIDADMEFEGAFLRADQALYCAKELGRNRFELSV